MTTRTQQLWFGPRLFVKVKSCIESTMVTFLFDNDEEYLFHLEVNILKDKMFSIERSITHGEPVDCLYWEEQEFEKVEEQFVVKTKRRKPVTPEQIHHFKTKWQEALDQMVNEDTFTFEIPTYLTEIFAIETELFHIDSQ